MARNMKIEHVEGKNNGNVMLYALSTCVWCKMTKKLLTDLGVAYDYTFVDLLQDTEREEALKELKKFNPSCSFPTVIIDGRAIVGYQEAKIREAFKNG
jgi:glutaredoxin-like protein NrdH